MIRIEKTDNYYTVTGYAKGKAISINLPLSWKFNEYFRENEQQSWPESLLNEALELIEDGKLKAEEGSIFENDNSESLSGKTGFSGAILVHPATYKTDGDTLQLIPLYKEEIGFARRLGWRKLYSMFRFLTPDELNLVSSDRYNIVKDPEGRRNCF